VKPLASNSLQAASYDEIRLPSFIQAENYKLDFTTDLESFKFHGQVQISLDISKDTDFVVVHKMDMNVEFIKMAQGANVYSYSRMEDKLDKEYVIIHFKNTMPKGKYELTLKYNASLNNNMRGYYLSTYTKKNKIQHLATTVNFN
jgi:puromycin-sensitive aminopeptidase